VHAADLLHDGPPFVENSDDLLFSRKNMRNVQRRSTLTQLIRGVLISINQLGLQQSRLATNASVIVHVWL
jgi:hypothetical protein